MKKFSKNQLQKNNVIFFDVGSNLGSEIKFIIKILHVKYIHSNLIKKILNI